MTQIFDEPLNEDRGLPDDTIVIADLSQLATLKNVVVYFMEQPKGEYVAAPRKVYDNLREIEQLAREAADVFAEIDDRLGLCTECAEVLKQLRAALGGGNDGSIYIS